MDVHTASDSAPVALAASGEALEHTTLSDFGNLANKLTIACSFTGCACCCVPTDARLTLGPEEAVFKTVSLISTTVTRRPYGELGSVDINNHCGFCWSVASGLGGISPGCGCEEQLVKDIHAELKKRQQTRGDQGQIQRAEQNLSQLRIMQDNQNMINVKLDAIMAKMNITAPKGYEMVGRK